MDDFGSKSPKLPCRTPHLWRLDPVQVKWL